MIVGQHAPGVDRKLEEQLVFRGGQLHRPSGHRHAAFGVVDRQVPQQIGSRALVLSDAAPLRRTASILATSSVGEKGLTM